MTKVLITGATGNVGIEVINALCKQTTTLDIYAGVRDVNKDKITFPYSNVQLLQFDFTDSKTYNTALTGCDLLFLLRPPQISEVKKYFKPLIDACVNKGVKHIIFLSVQGVEKSRIIPHYKIERLIINSNIPYTFLRPAYFMQNFTTTLHADLVNKKRIFLPAGKAKFSLIDVRDIGAVSAQILSTVTEHINKSYELTSEKKLTFEEMAKILSNKLDSKIEYISPCLINFFLSKRREGVPVMLILVMIMLHYFPRFQSEPEITDWVEKITSRPPISFDEFILNNKKLLMA